MTTSNIPLRQYEIRTTYEVLVTTDKVVDVHSNWFLFAQYPSEVEAGSAVLRALEPRDDGPDYTAAKLVTASTIIIKR